MLHSVFKTGCTIYIIKGGPITQEQIDEGLYPQAVLGYNEYQFSDGPPGKRGYSEDYPTIVQGVAILGSLNPNFNFDYAYDNTEPTASEHPEGYSPELVKRGACDIASERARQIAAEGWSPEHDDQYTEHELIYAALCFLLAGRDQESCQHPPEEEWPWDISWWKPENPRRSLVKAGALIAAEIDRLDRAILSELDKSKEVDPLVERFRALPLHGDAGCDKLTDEEWKMVANAALLTHPTTDTQSDAVREKYQELLFAVSMKHPGETRHETALRYIHQAEKSSNDEAAAIRNEAANTGGEK